MIGTFAMDNNDTQSAQGVAEPVMDTGDWRAQLQDESRQRIRNKIVDILKRQLPYYGPEELEEIKRIGTRFEEKVHSIATSQSDYLKKISLKMVAVESKYQNTVGDSLQSDSASNNQDLGDAVSEVNLS